MQKLIRKRNQAAKRVLLLFILRGKILINLIRDYAMHTESFFTLFSFFVSVLGQNPSGLSGLL
jgi:hypothetical protein